MNKDIKVQPGDVLTFKGVMWHEKDWEFDAPCIVYSPVLRYFQRGSICKETIDDCIEDVCIDICVGNGIAKYSHPSDLKEFKWRGWSINRLSRRKNAVHVTTKVEFFINDYGELDCKTVSKKVKAAK